MLGSDCLSKLVFVGWKVKARFEIPLELTPYAGDMEGRQFSP